MALMVDLSDVRFGRDPFQYFEKSGKNLLIGAEEKLNIPYMNAVSSKCWERENWPEKVKVAMQKLKERTFIQVNAGVFGGRPEYA